MDNQPMQDLLWHSLFRWQLPLEQVTGDTRYGTADNIVAIEDAGLRAYIPLTDFDKRSPLYGKQRFRYDAAKKYVVSSTLERVDWNAELVRGDLSKAVQQLKRESGNGLFVAGLKLPLALAEMGLDAYEFVVQTRIAGHGTTLFAGLSKHLDLKLVNRLEFGSGAVAMRYALTR